MTETVDFLELYTGQMDQAFYKNDFIAKTSGDYIGFLNKTITDQQEVIDILEEYALLSSYGAVLFGQDIGDGGDLSLTGILRHPQMKIYALVLEKRLLADTGSFHEELPVLNTYEFLCRIAGAAKIYGIPCAEEENAEQSSGDSSDGSDVDDSGMPAEMGKTLAYIMRRYMTQLREEGSLQEILEGMFVYAGEMGCDKEFRTCLDEMLNSLPIYEKLARNTAPFFFMPVNNSCHGVPRRFAAMLSDALAEQGQAVVTVDGKYGQVKVFEEETVSAVLKGVIGFQSTTLESEGIRRMGCPKYQFMFDNPLYFNKLLRNLPKEYVILYQDRNYAEYIKTYYGTENALQFPPAGEDAGLAENKDRPYDVVFIGTYPNDLSTETFDEEEKSFCDYMMKHPNMDFGKGYLEYLSSKGKIVKSDEPADREMVSNNLNRMQKVCRVVTGLYRVAVIETLLEAGITVHVYGETWMNFNTTHEKYLIMHPEASVEESLSVLGHAKIGLNIMSWHKTGMTERIANIMMSGAVCLSDESSYLREHYTDGEEMVLFKLTELSELPQKVLPLLRDETLRQQIAAKAYGHAAEEHTWKKRAEELLELHRGMFQYE